MELSLIDSLASLGVGAVLGLVIFFMYRKDRKSSEARLREDRKYSEDRLTGLIEADQETRQKHTQVMTELITYLKAKNGGKN